MIKKDYYKKNISNHLFLREKQQKAPGAMRFKISLICLFLTILAWFGFILYAPYFTIQNLDFSGTDNFLAEKINIALKGEFESHKLFILNKSNYFIFDEIGFKQKLEEMFMLSELEITKKFPNVLSVNAKKKTTSLVLVFNNEAYFVDYNGMVIDVLKNLENITGQIPRIILKNTNTALNARINIFTKKQVSDYMEIYEKLDKEGVAMDSIILEDIKNTKITIRTKDGFLIYMTSEDSVQNQIDNLRIILKEKIGDDRTNLQYIDLRFGVRIFYK